MKNYEQYTYILLGVNLFLVLVTVIYLLFFKTDPWFAFLDGIVG